MIIKLENNTSSGSDRKTAEIFKCERDDLTEHLLIGKVQK